MANKVDIDKVFSEDSIISKNLPSGDLTGTDHWKAYFATSLLFKGTREAPGYMHYLPPRVTAGYY